MQEKSAQAENGLWNAVGEVLDTEMSTVEEVLESLARTQKGNVTYSGSRQAHLCYYPL